MLTRYQSILAQPRDFLLIILAAWIGITLAEHKADKDHVDLDSLSNLLLWSLGGFIIGGRLSYIIEHWSVFLPAPLNIFSLNFSLFEPLGGLGATLMIALIFGQRYRLPLWYSLDALTPFLATLAVGLAFSHLATGKAFGQQTTVPWAIEQWGSFRQPTQIYEIFSGLIILGIVLRLKTSTPGWKFLIFVSFTSGSQLIMQGFRGDNILLPGGLRLEQVIAWIGLAVSLAGLDYLANQNQFNKNQNHPSDTKTKKQTLQKSSPLNTKTLSNRDTTKHEKTKRTSNAN